MRIPEPRDERSASVLNAIYDLFVRFNRWPTFSELDKYLDGKGESEVDEVLTSMPEGLLYGVGAPLVPATEIALTAVGLRACHHSGEELDVFLRIVRHAIQLEQEQGVGEPQPSLIPADIAGAVALPAAGRSELLQRVGLVLQVERWGWSGASKNTDGWKFEISRDVRRLRGVTSIEDYWYRLHPNPDAAGRGLSPTMELMLDALAAHPTGVESLNEAGFSIADRDSDRAFQSLLSHGFVRAEHLQVLASGKVGLVAGVCLTSEGFRVVSELHGEPVTGHQFTGGSGSSDLEVPGRPEGSGVDADRDRGEGVVTDQVPPARAFIAHGRDPNNIKHVVARLIGAATNLEPVILDEQLNQGRTLIEKFRAHATTDCVAIVLMTGDDEGRLMADDERGVLEPRPRQNVVLELGYFLALLDAARVIVLREEKVKGPSDIDGVLYLSLDQPSWPNKLAKELDGLGVTVDYRAVL